VYRHAPTLATCPITPIECEAVDADDAVCVLGFQVSFCNDSDRRTVALEVGGEMLDGARLRQCGGVEDINGRCQFTAYNTVVYVFLF